MNKYATKIIILRTTNVSPEEELTEKISPLLSKGYRVKSANTSLSPWGKLGDGPHHVFYVTTVVLEQDAGMKNVKAKSTPIAPRSSNRYKTC